jgi:hypothetical protein
LVVWQWFCANLEKGKASIIISGTFEVAMTGSFKDQIFLFLRAGLFVLTGVCSAQNIPVSSQQRQAIDPRAQVTLQQCKPPVTTTPLSKILNEIQIAAMGDAIPHGMVLMSAEQADIKDADGSSLNHDGFDALVTGMRDELLAADIGFCNLEAPVAPKTGKKTVPFMFNAPPGFLAALTSIGINVVSVANNHVFDQSTKGFLESIEQLSSSPLTFIGAGKTCAEAASPKMIEVHGIKLAFLGATQVYNNRPSKSPDKPCVLELKEDLVLPAVAAARALGAEMVILSAHWGEEYQIAPRKQEIDLAHRLLDGGVDVILGHHPHVLQPVEVYLAKDGRNTLVSYSLGNFIANQSRFYVYGLHPDKAGYPRDGVILRFKVARKDYGNGQIRVELTDLSVQPLWLDNNALERQQKNGPIVIRVVANDRAAAEARTELVHEKDEKKILELKKRVELLEVRRKLAGAILGEDLLRDQ